jgi:hypothetical protein
METSRPAIDSLQSSLEALREPSHGPKRRRKSSHLPFSGR